MVEEESKTTAEIKPLTPPVKYRSELNVKEPSLRFGKPNTMNTINALSRRITRIFWILLIALRPNKLMTKNNETVANAAALTGICGKMAFT